MDGGLGFIQVDDGRRVERIGAWDGAGWMALDRGEVGAVLVRELGAFAGCGRGQPKGEMAGRAVHPWGRRCASRVVMGCAIGVSARMGVWEI